VDFLFTPFTDETTYLRITELTGDVTETSERGFDPRGRNPTVMARPSRYPKELLDRGVRLALEGERPIPHIAQDLGIGAETLRKHVRRAQIDAGKRGGVDDE
jgi:hypothetical protein